MITRWFTKASRGAGAAAGHVLRADMRRSPFYRLVARVIMAWLLSSLALGALAAGGLQLPRWGTWLVVGVCTLVVCLPRRRSRDIN